MRDERPGVDRDSFFLEDYQEASVAFTLRVPPASRFVIQTSEDSNPVIFTRE
jgi:hypothetical protein